MYLAGLLVLTGVLAVSAQTPANLIENEIRQTYDFAPHTLSSEQLRAKSVTLDAFWSKAKSDPSSYIPVLQAELQDPSSKAFFLFDGSQLLLSLAYSPENRHIAVLAMSRADLHDINPAGYFYAVHRIANFNEDTAVAALHILEDPQFQVQVPEHALTLGQNYALIYMLLPEDPKYWLSPAISRLESETDPTAQQSLLLLLWYAQVPEADAAVKKFSANPGAPEASRKLANQLLARSEEASRIKRPVGKDEGAIRKDRLARMKAVSDEALYDLDSMTADLILARSRTK